MASDRQIAANRRKVLMGIGWRTKVGNALTHALSEQVLLESEERRLSGRPCLTLRRQHGN